MTQGKRPPLRRFLRELSRPVEWISKKAKKALRHDPVPVPAATHYVVDPSVAANLARTDELLLAFMRSSQRQNAVPVQVQALATPCQISSDRMLIAHPHADFFLCPTHELRPLGMLLVRQFDSSLSQTILENVKPGDHVGVLGDFAGYHTLSLATLVGNTGEVISLDQGNDEIVDLNVGANLLRNVMLGAETTSANHLGMLNQIYIRVGSELQIDYALLDLLCRSAAQATWHIHVVDGQRSLQETKTKALDIFRCLSGYGMSVEQGGLSINLDEQATRFDWDQPCRLSPNDRDVAPRKVG